MMSIAKNRYRLFEELTKNNFWSTVKICSRELCDVSKHERCTYVMGSFLRGWKHEAGTNRVVCDEFSGRLWFCAAEHGSAFGLGAWCVHRVSAAETAAGGLVRQVPYYLRRRPPSRTLRDQAELPFTRSCGEEV